MHFDVPVSDFGVLGLILLIRRPPRTPNRTPWGPDLDFSIFLKDFGIPWDQLWIHFDDVFIIWPTQLQHTFHSSFFVDLGADMAPGCEAWMFSKHGKYNGLSLDLQFRRGLTFKCLGEGFGHHFGRLLVALG